MTKTNPQWFDNLTLLVILASDIDWLIASNKNNGKHPFRHWLFSGMLKKCNLVNSTVSITYLNTVTFNKIIIPEVRKNTNHEQYLLGDFTNFGIVWNSGIG